MPHLTLKQSSLRLKSVPGWAMRSRAIRRKFQFEGFMDGISFVNRVAKAAEKSDHHPDIDIRWNRVSLTFSTHSEGGLTAKDFKMALQCSALFSRHFGPG